MKKKILSFILSVCFIIPSMFVFSGCSLFNNTEYPWDNLGGGGKATDISTSDDLAENYLDQDVSEDTSYVETTANEIITLNGNTFTSTNSSTSVKLSDNILTIKSSGVYELTGNFNGAIEVKKEIAGDVQIILNNATISTLDSQYCAAIAFNKPGDVEYQRILTIKEGSTNTLSDSAGDSETINEDYDGAIIKAKKRSLIINGTGTLNLICKGDDTNAIQAKTELAINGPKINITSATNNGIKADKKVVIKNAKITLSSNGDGIKTDIEPENESEILTYTSESSYGYIYIENSNIDITCGDDGISANNCLYITNTNLNTIKITTNGGAPTTVTETSSDNADGKALKVDGISYNDVDYTATYDENYGLVITGGNFELNSNDDAISSKGNLIISNGTFDITTGDDGIHAEYLTKIIAGDITINNCYEGIEGATVEILGGTINLKSVDDGINAANSDLTNYSYYIYISGGTLTINASGDGIDSNGTIKITGGTIYVNGPTSSDNAALDADSGILTNGGDIIALGSKGMVETPSTNSTQCYINLTLSSTASAGTTITIKNSSNQTICSYTSLKKFQSAIISLDEFSIGSSYTITVGSTSYSVTLNSIATAVGSGAQGNKPGRMW